MYSGGVTRKKVGWYGVRTLLRLVATGKPKRHDKHFDPASTLVEDRVVLFKANSFESAIEQAESEAKQYCRRTLFTNIYGQSVRMRFVGVVDAFSVLDDKPRAGSEVYSSTALVVRSVSDGTLLAQRFGEPEAPGAESRYKFRDGRILGQALRANRAETPDATRSSRRRQT